jgi:hypothetical protein
MRNEVVQVKSNKVPPKTCDLPASGFTFTLPGVHQWAKEAVQAIRSKLDTGEISVRVWAYREQGHEWLACDFINKDKDRESPENGLSITFLIGYPHNFGAEDLNVPDMSEALHMIGLVVTSLGAKVELGLSKNETNPSCTKTPWKPGQTNAPVDL